MVSILFRSAHYLMFLCLLAGFPALASTHLDLPAYSKTYDVNRNPSADGRAALKLAKETQRKILVEVGGDWCSWCHVLDRFIKDHPTLEARLHETFVLLKVNVSDANDNAEFMASLPPALGYPHMYIIGADGIILHSQDTAEFLEKKKYSEQQFLAFLDRWKNKAS